VFEVFPRLNAPPRRLITNELGCEPLAFCYNRRHLPSGTVTVLRFCIIHGEFVCRINIQLKYPPRFLDASVARVRESSSSLPWSSSEEGSSSRFKAASPHRHCPMKLLPAGCSERVKFPIFRCIVRSIETSLPIRYGS